MSEANRRLQDAVANPQGFNSAQVMTEANRLARNAIKAQWQAQGLKVAHIEHGELVKAASAYLDTHRAELVIQARANLSSDAQCRKP
jgi:hypothetical protein